LSEWTGASSRSHTVLFRSERSGAKVRGPHTPGPIPTIRSVITCADRVPSGERNTRPRDPRADDARPERRDCRGAFAHPDDRG
jgi:hypothetical protein